jgi:molybdopterin biosynthesis enzyme
MPLLSVVIPVYNERDTVREVVDRVRAALVGDGPELRVRPYRNQKSGVLSSMIEADVLVDVPGEASELAAGSEVDILWPWEDKPWRS